MKYKLLSVALVLTALGSSAFGAVVTVSQTDNILIPDNDLNGVAETISLGSSIQSITDVQLTLNIGATPNSDLPFNGDYYAYLLHGSSEVVLLNRVGVTAVNSYGSADTGFDLTLSDSGTDIHNYQAGAFTLNANGQLTGTWAPDGRTESPLTVSDTSTRGPLLDTFDGEDASGDWTLFIADTSSGGMGDLDSWSLEVTGNPRSVGPGVVPEPTTVISGALLFLPFAVSLFRSLRRKAPQVKPSP